MTAWGKFRLIYRGQNQDAIQAMMDNFGEHLANLRLAQEEQSFYISTAILNRISSLIDEANAENNTEAKLELAKQINAEFNAINSSYAIYNDLNGLMEYCYNQGDAILETDTDLSNALYAKGDEIQEHLLSGDLTDEEVKQYETDIRDDVSIGGGFYVQGDLLDAEGNEIAYGSMSNVYPLLRQDDGTYTGIFKTQNRANLVHADARAGVYFTRFDQTFKSDQQYRRFVTPEYNTHPLIAGAGQDYQMIGAEMRVTLNPEDSIVVFDPIEYAWHDRVFVCGSIINKDGNEHRWKNDEMAPLEHVGDGLYVGTVRFFEDYVYPGYATFIIMASRSTLEDVENSTVTRPGWLEASYTSAENDCYLTLDKLTNDLVRGWGNQHRLRFEWPEGDDPTDYLVVFNMNTRSIGVKLDDGSGYDGIQTITEAPLSANGIYNLAGQKMSARQLPKGIYIVNGKKIAIK